MDRGPLIILLIALLTANVVLSEVKDYDYPTLWRPNSLKNYTVDYTDGPAKLKGYVAHPNISTGPLPLVIIYPDWDGISNYERFRANLIASLGYVGFVADVFSQAVVQGPSLPIANRSALLSEYRANSTFWRTRLLASYNEARNLTIVNKQKVIAIGYCFGGGSVLELIRSYPDSAGLLGVGGFHAGPLVTGGPQAEAGNPARVYVFNGAEDPGITEESLQAFEKEMRVANLTWAYYKYGKTVHAFTLLENPGWNGNKSMSNGYNAVADHSSWWALRGILLELFGLSNSSNPYTSTLGTFDYQTGIAGETLQSA